MKPRYIAIAGIIVAGVGIGLEYGRAFGSMMTGVALLATALFIGAVDTLKEAP